MPMQRAEPGLRILQRVVKPEYQTGLRPADHERHKPSIEYNASAVQINTKPARRAPPNGSLYNHTPSSNCKLGAMYCSSPSKESGMRRAAAPNINNGIAVIGPAAASSHFDDVDAAEKA